MIRNALALTLSTLVLGSTFALAAPTSAPATAHADLMNAQGGKIGTATFIQDPKGVRIQLQASSLSPGAHGVHIHEKGKCEGPDFKTAGAHLNPTHKEHGLKNAKGPHEGDMPELVVGNDGKVSAERYLKGATLTPGPESLLKTDGTSIVIHAKADDQKTDPSGNSGDRVACGVITGKHSD